MVTAFEAKDFVACGCRTSNPARVHGRFRAAGSESHHVYGIARTDFFGEFGFHAMGHTEGGSIGHGPLHSLDHRGMPVTGHQRAKAQVVVDVLVAVDVRESCRRAPRRRRSDKDRRRGNCWQRREECVFQPACGLRQTLGVRCSYRAISFCNVSCIFELRQVGRPVVTCGRSVPCGQYQRGKLRGCCGNCASILLLTSAFDASFRLVPLVRRRRRSSFKPRPLLLQMFSVRTKVLWRTASRGDPGPSEPHRRWNRRNSHQGSQIACGSMCYKTPRGIPS